MAASVALVGAVAHAQPSPEPGPAPAVTAAPPSSTPPGPPTTYRPAGPGSEAYAPVEPLYPDRPAPGPVRYKSYGFQILLVDAAAISLSALTERGEFFGLGYPFGSAAIHLLHGQRKRAMQSIGLRLGVPFLGALGGAMLFSSGSDNDWDGDYDVIRGMALGAGLGLLSAVLIDYLYLARKPVKSVPLGPVGVSALPNVGVTHQGVTLGLSGQF